MSENEVKLVSRKIARTEYVIAIFKDGYASGWEFAVKEAFREALDIRLTPKTVNKVSKQVYTQGHSFSFKTGDTLHNSKLASENWEQFLKGKNPVTLQVQNSTSSGFETKNTYTLNGNEVKYTKVDKSGLKNEVASSFVVEEQSFDPGIVILKEYRPNESKTALLEVKEIKMKQDEFVSLLQTGKYFDHETKGEIDMRFQ